MDQDMEAVKWTREENKLFENALVDFPPNIDGRWRKIAEAVPGKTEEQVKLHYQKLLDDLDAIEKGQMELPIYAEDFQSESYVRDLKNSGISFVRGRKTGIPWTEHEHRRFMEGLEKYGKGEWRSISRNSVLTRSPMQVAVYAQKYFAEQSLITKDTKNIRDITATDTTVGVLPPPPVTTSNQGAEKGEASGQTGNE